MAGVFQSFNSSCETDFDFVVADFDDVEGGAEAEACDDPTSPSDE